MTVGFVNAGLLTLKQAISVVMGANIGTTVTSWILSLTGIESSNFFVNMLKPSSFSPILALIGVFFIMFSKNEKKKNIGIIMVGFAILMFGMETMSSALKPLSDVPEFRNFIIKFSNPILGMMAGLAITGVIQSSSASVGILQALSSTGFVSFGTAIPIIMGQNIGTCVTAIISAIGANRNAKRASLIHLYFNLIGTMIFMIIFYSLNTLLNFAFLEKSINPAGIAIIHSLFNVSATIILLPFSKILVRLAYISIPEREEEIAEAGLNFFQLLEDRFLEQPSYAVEQCKNVTVNMAKLAKDSLYGAIDLIDKYDEALANKVIIMEDNIDKYEDELGNYLLKLNRKSLFNRDSKLVSELLHCIGDFERISDHATNVMESAREMHDKNISFSVKAQKELKIFAQAIKDIVSATFIAFENEDTELARTIEPFEEVIDDLSEEIKRSHINRLRDEECTIELGFILSDVINNYERIGYMSQKHYIRNILI
jgi:phosphate:Na+ symporter